MSKGQLATNSTAEEMALALLGDGIAQNIVASHLGVTESYISQLISRDDFTQELIRLRYENLSKHNARDKEYDSIEDELVEKMRESLPLLFRPEQILKAIQVINAAKRRGSSAPAATQEQQTVVKIVMPVRVINRFTTNITNQVIEAGDQRLVTVQSGSLMKHLKEREDNRPAQIPITIDQEAIPHGHARNEADSRLEQTSRVEQATSPAAPSSHPVSA